MMKVYLFNLCFSNNKKLKEKLNKFNSIPWLILLGDINFCFYTYLRLANLLFLNRNGYRHAAKNEYFYEHTFFLNIDLPLIPGLLM